MFVKVDYLGFFPLGDDIAISSVHFMKCPWRSLNGTIIPIGKKNVVSPLSCSLFCAVENDEAVFFFASEYGYAHYHVYVPNEKSKIRLEKKYAKVIEELKTIFRGFSYERIVEFMADKYLPSEGKAFLSEDGMRRAVVSIGEDKTIVAGIERLHIHDTDEMHYGTLPGYWLDEAPCISFYDSVERAIEDLGLKPPKWKGLISSSDRAHEETDYLMSNPSFMEGYKEAKEQDRSTYEEIDLDDER
ncbi:MAG: hypothetical protein J6328_01040 [Bacilli bacterium]|nr:hypothetical protein [Bacilli bacterium]